MSADDAVTGTHPTASEADTAALTDEWLAELRAAAEMADKWEAAAKAVRKSEHHWPADCLMEAAATVRILADRLAALATPAAPTEAAADPAAVEPWPLNDSVTALSQMIDDSYPKRLDSEAHLWRRCAKVAEENGEVTEALLGLIGENPRKGRTHEVADVRKELFDVALAALGAAAHIDGNRTDVAAMFRHHAHRVRLRLAAAIRAEPDRTEET